MYFYSQSSIYRLIFISCKEVTFVVRKHDEDGMTGLDLEGDMIIHLLLFMPYNLQTCLVDRGAWRVLTVHLC